MDAKWEHVFGEDLYGFLKTAEEMIPIDSGVKLYNGADSYRSLRSQYYMYPRTWPREKEYILSFHSDQVIPENYEIVYQNSEFETIYKRVGG